MSASQTRQALALVADPQAGPDAGHGENGVAGAETTPNRSRHDDTAFKQFAGRMIRAYGRRAETADPWVVRDLLEIRGEIDRAVLGAIRAYRRADLSWGQIGYDLGIDRVACFKRYARQIDLIEAAAVYVTDRPGIEVTAADVARATGATVEDADDALRVVALDKSDGRLCERDGMWTWKVTA